MFNSVVAGSRPESAAVKSGSVDEEQSQDRQMQDNVQTHCAC